MRRTKVERRRAELDRVAGETGDGTEVHEAMLNIARGEIDAARTRLLSVREREIERGQEGRADILRCVLRDLNTIETDAPDVAVIRAMDIIAQLDWLR